MNSILKQFARLILGSIILSTVIALTQTSVIFTKLSIDTLGLIMLSTAYIFISWAIGWLIINE